MLMDRYHFTQCPSCGSYIFVVVDHPMAHLADWLHCIHSGWEILHLISVNHSTQVGFRAGFAGSILGVNKEDAQAHPTISHMFHRSAAAQPSYPR